MRSLCAPTWIEAKAEVMACRSAGIRPRTWIFMLTSDQGPDEIKAKKIILAEICDVDEVQVWLINCLIHNPHLIVKSGLAICDDILTSTTLRCKYFGSLAKIVNVWRDAGRDVSETWAREFGPVVAKKVAGTLPPRCLSGRWGSVFATEVRIIEAMQNGMLKRVLTEVFGKRKYREPSS